MSPAAPAQSTVGESLLRRALANHLVVCVSRVHRGWPSESLPAETAAEVIRESGTQACVLHVPAHDDVDTADAVRFDQQSDWFGNEQPVTFFNTSGASTGVECAATVRLLDEWASHHDRLRGQYLFKLEVFDAQLRCNDGEVLNAIERLPAVLRYRCVPIIEPGSALTERLLELGVAGLRLRAGEIRRGTGITMATQCRRAIEAIAGRVPVMLEGGLASVDDVRRAAQLGADAVLFNTAVAAHPDPVAFVRELRAAAERYWR